ncbi:MAG: DegV family protein [Acidaminococcaceae bacterium]|nr:DegV family protein [Acidaminococcaceae bacterium]
MCDELHVVLDSISCAEETPLKDDPRCHVLKLIVRHGNVEWPDGERTLQEMFSMVDESGILPATSQPPIGAMLELLTELCSRGKKVFFITCSSVLSGTYQTACVAAKQVMSEIKGADIRVVDTKTCACPISGIAMDVLEHAAKGVSMDELEAYANDLVHRTETFFTVNTLEYLQKGGRIGAIGALIGNIFGIRPIAHIRKDGQLEIADKCRTRKKTLKRMIELACSQGDVEKFYVAHADVYEEAAALYAELQERCPGVPGLLTGIGTVLAAHLGPGVIGVFVKIKKT